jgi:hypothetical protein
MIPGEKFIKEGEIELNGGRRTITLTVFLETLPHLNWFSPVRKRITRRQPIEPLDRVLGAGRHLLALINDFPRPLQDRGRADGVAVPNLRARAADL